MKTNWAKYLGSKEFTETAAICATLTELAAAVGKQLKRNVGNKTLTEAYAKHYAKLGLPRSIAEIIGGAKPQAGRLTQKESKRLLAEAEQAKSQVETLEAFKQNKGSFVITPRKSKPLQATAVALASDWHVEERIRPETVNGRNEYTMDIAKDRAERFFRAIDWLVKHHQNNIHIEHLVLWLGGDLMSGYIHEELEESNECSPTEAILFLQRVLRGGINYLKSTGLKLTIPCSYGNHGRTTKKRRISTGASNSYEWLLYKTLEQEYSDDPAVNFIVATGDHIYLPVYDQIIRFTHGDNFGYGGGVGGLSVPLNRGVQRLETFMHADLTCVGHFHQLHNFSNIVVNGSLVGYSPYAIKINAPYEPARQAFFLMMPGKGKTMFAPIWLED